MATRKRVFHLPLFYSFAMVSGSAWADRYNTAMVYYPPDGGDIVYVNTESIKTIKESIKSATMMEVYREPSEGVTWSVLHVQANCATNSNDQIEVVSQDYFSSKNKAIYPNFSHSIYTRNSNPYLYICMNPEQRSVKSGSARFWRPTPNGVLLVDFAESLFREYPTGNQSSEPTAPQSAMRPSVAASEVGVEASAGNWGETASSPGQSAQETPQRVVAHDNEDPDHGNANQANDAEAAERLRISRLPLAGQILTEELDQTVLGDSQNWMVNHYEPGSMHDVRIYKGSSKASTFSIRGEYRYSDGDSGWVVAEISRGKIACLEYWDFPGSCDVPSQDRPKPADLPYEQRCHDEPIWSGGADETPRIVGENHVCN